MDEQISYMNSEQGVPTPFIAAYSYSDMQRLHGGPNLHKDPKIGLPLKTDMFTVQYLQKAGY
jgi:hypothetical protein